MGEIDDKRELASETVQRGISDATQSWLLSPSHSMDTDGWIHGCMDGWMDSWMDGWKPS